MKVGILVVAYEAEATLESVLNRIPQTFRASIHTILVCDDASTDDTYQVGMRVKESRPDLPLQVLKWLSKIPSLSLKGTKYESA